MEAIKEMNRNNYSENIDDLSRVKGMYGKLKSQMSKVPSDSFLWLAAGSILGSLALRLSGKRDRSLFVGQWAPTLAILGVFTKLTNSNRS